MVKEWRVGYSDGSGSDGEYGEGVYITSGNLPIVRGGVDDWGCAVGVIDPRHAPLIAAAPNLLAALESLYGAVGSCVELTPDVLRQARAAIKKAKGE